MDSALPLPSSLGVHASIDDRRMTADAWSDLVDLQADVETIGRDGRNADTDYAYTTAESVFLYARGLFKSHGFALITNPITVAAPERSGRVDRRIIGRVELSWRLVHSSGALLAGVASMPVVETNRTPAHKAAAGVTTYLRGFLVLGLLNMDRASVDPSEDLDAGDHRPPPPGRPPAQPPSAAERVRGLRQRVKRLADEVAAKKGEDLSDTVARMRAALKIEDEERMNPQELDLAAVWCTSELRGWTPAPEPEPEPEPEPGAEEVGS